PTSTCLSMVPSSMDKDRCQVFCSGASSELDLKLIGKQAEEAMQACKCMYAEAACLPGAFELYKRMAESCGANNQSFVLNLSSHSAVRAHSSQIKELLKYTSVVFGK